MNIQTYLIIHHFTINFYFSGMTMKLLTIISFALFLTVALISCNDDNENLNDSATTEKFSNNIQEDRENMGDNQMDEINANIGGEDSYDDGEIIEGEIDDEVDENDIDEIDELDELDEKQELFLLPDDEAYEKFPTD
jgi:hypothetical protein